MCENFSFVTMKTYSADMAELSATAGSVIERLKREKEELKELVAQLICAAGGTIEVSRRIQCAPTGSFELEMEREQSKCSNIYRCRLRGN